MESRWKMPRAKTAGHAAERDGQESAELGPTDQRARWQPKVSASPSAAAVADNGELRKSDQTLAAD
jgi:hypothetical protein